MDFSHTFLDGHTPACHRSPALPHTTVDEPAGHADQPTAQLVAQSVEIAKSMSFSVVRFVYRHNCYSASDLARDEVSFMNSWFLRQQGIELLGCRVANGNVALG